MATDCYSVSGPQSGYWCCSVPEETEEEICHRRKREQILLSLSRVKGLSPYSRVVLQPDVDYVIDELEQKDVEDSNKYLCGTQTSVFSNSVGLLIWLGLYAVAMLGLQFRLYRMIGQLPLPEQWPDLGPWVKATAEEYNGRFDAYYSIGIGAMMLVMTLAFSSARSNLGSFIDRMTKHLVWVAQQELRTDIRDSVDHDFYSFINRLPQYFCISEDLTKSTIKRIHRRLHTDLDVRTSVVDFELKGPLAIRYEVQKRMSNRLCCLSLWCFFLPWLLTMMANTALVLRVYTMTYKQDHEIRVNSPEVITEGEYGAALRDEGLQHIGYALLVNLIAWIYLLIVQLRCLTFYVIKHLYPRINVAITSYCDRLLARTWEGAVLSGLAEYIDDVKANVGFLEEEIRLSMPSKDSHRPPTYGEHTIDPYRQGLSSDFGSANVVAGFDSPDRTLLPSQARHQDDLTVSASRPPSSLLSPRVSDSDLSRNRRHSALTEPLCKLSSCESAYSGSK
ncbi:putative transmembrane protein [Toxoplasma gondii GAB2-2007-GAL-DOM2]|uniref:Transmembrane protein n=5 Tax=Toxoplasma gondii TaxID=5811 RepID=S7USA4_TOXGG|nr:hypothetical protein TGGT1_240570 [Toxoplasma gondii GT1]KFG39413.1 putative transmembrane protein [Toxoplasma gondii GAB2-2007-GAL-DOM2]KFG48646.1 putative transmembrane protein [Toxoplasma gondii FOU]RQX70840.1 putative transmembrane protein [Toxoplasma gondii CAST]